MLSEARTRRLAAMILIAVLGSPGISADPPPESTSGATEPGAETADGASNEASSQRPAEEPVEPFVPSESISADSAVAFPVDI